MLLLLVRKILKKLFPGELLIIMSNSTPPWYADFANDVVCHILPDRPNIYQQKRFLFDVKK